MDSDESKSNNTGIIIKLIAIQVATPAQSAGNQDIKLIEYRIKIELKFSLQ